MSSVDAPGSHDFELWGLCSFLPRGLESILFILWLVLEDLVLRLI